MITVILLVFAIGVMVGCLIGCTAITDLIDTSYARAARRRAAIEAKVKEIDLLLAAPRCHACGATTCPAAGKATVDDCPAWQAAEARIGFLPTYPIDGPGWTTLPPRRADP